VDLSVVIATRNRADLLASTLRSIARQQAPGVEWEVIVVDNGSVDTTSHVLREAGRSLPLVALAEPTPGKNRAINRAVAAARGELLLFSDDDVVAEQGWIAEMVAASLRWPDDAVFGGEIRAAFPDATPTWLQEPFHPALNFARYGAAEPEGPTNRIPNGPNFAVRANALGGLRFSESIGPDGSTGYAMGSETEMLERLRARGARYIYVPTAVVYHIIRPEQLTLGYLLGRSFRFGRGEVRRKGAPRPDVPRLLGAPRYLWREAAEAAMACAAGLVRGRRHRLTAGLRLVRLCGVIAEHRVLSASRPAE
jgi:glycosyltransferase involved in cell wall biosynthesis